jgi:SAM-dependent methyltransferase
MRAWLYDRLLLATTSPWYREVLARVPTGGRILDVGIGTAGALVRHAAALRARDLRVVGLDVDPDYVRRALRKVEDSGLGERVDVVHEAFEDHEGGPYDAVYFGGSFMLLADPAAALAHARTLLAPGGRVWFTQTFQDRRSAVMERLKPTLKAFTSVDFGRVTYEADFLDALARGGLEVETHEVLGRTAGRSSRLVGAKAA